MSVTGEVVDGKLLVTMADGTVETMVIAPPEEVPLAVYEEDQLKMNAYWLGRAN